MNKIVSNSADVNMGWSIKDAICKGVAFRNAQKHMDLDNLTEREQLLYFQRRRFAVPMYIVGNSSDFSPFYVVTKKEYERMDLPEKVVPWTMSSCYRLDAPFAWINGIYDAVNDWPYGKDDFAGALTSFANDAKKMSLYLLHYAGYLNTGNFHWRRKVTVQKGVSDVTVTVELSDSQSQQSERFVFLYRSVKTATGFSSCHLHSLMLENEDNGSKYLLEPGCHSVVFDKLVCNAQCVDAVNLDI